MSQATPPPRATVTLRRKNRRGRPAYLHVPGRDLLVSLGPDPITIGSDPGCDVVLDDPTVSRRHCELSWEGESVYVADLDSKNGVILQGARVRRAEMLVGDRLQLGAEVLVLVDNRHGSGANEVLPGVIGVSAGMKRLSRLVRLLATSDLSVLIVGETGTGKELVARALHQLGPRAGGPFVAINCGAIPPELLEAELFGHEQGAYTGANRSRPGLFELANGGTIFLDEVLELPEAQQPKLLRVLEERCLRRVGGRQNIALDVRVVAAGPPEIEERRKRGRFRQDLFYRLSEAEVPVPPLRERRADIPLLVDHFLGETLGGTPPSDVVLAGLQRADFEGNVRQLRSLVRRAGVLGWSQALAPHLSRLTFGAGEGALEAADYGRGLTDHGQLRSLQRDAILRAIIEAQGNKTQAARLIGMPKTTYADRLARVLDELPDTHPARAHLSAK